MYMEAFFRLSISSGYHIDKTEKYAGRPNVITSGIPDARQELSIVSSDPWPES